jgi:hypothetical protein
MAEFEFMEHRADNLIDKLLRGIALGAAAALRACPEDVAAKARERFGERASCRVRFVEPCRTEHPHSAFLRKPIGAEGMQRVQTTLFAPAGKLAELRSPEGEALEWFVKKPGEFEVLRGFLRDVELCPAKLPPAPEGCSSFALLGLTPVRELETRWAGPELAAQAMIEQNEAAASCLRKLERHLHRRCEEAHRLGCRVGILRDMAAEPLPETYMLHAGRHIEWMRHAGLSPFVEAARPGPNLLAALFAANAGARVSLYDPALCGPEFAPPEGMRFLLDADARAGLGELRRETIGELFSRCGAAVVLVDCAQAGEEDVFRTIDALMETAR